MDLDAFIPLAAASCAIDAVVAAVSIHWVAGRRRGQPPRLTLAGLLVAFALGGAVFALKTPALWALGVGGFGFLHLVYLDLVVVLPALTLLVVALRRRLRPTRVVVGLSAAVGVLSPAAGVYASFIEPARLQLEAPTLVLSPPRAGSDPVRIGVLADLQMARVGGHERNAVARLMALRPDVIVIPGDIFQGPYGTLKRQLPELRGLLRELRAPGGVYFVLGDCDHPRQAKRILEGLEITMLVDEVAAAEVGDRRLTIGGCSLECTGPQALATIRQLERAGGEQDIRLLLAHRPDAVLALEPGSRIDLLIAGHTHGGQVQLPFIGPPITHSRVPRPVAAGGLHELEGRRIYVSRGVGVERRQAPRIRFLCPPEITLITIE